MGYRSDVEVILRAQESHMPQPRVEPVFRLALEAHERAPAQRGRGGLVDGDDGRGMANIGRNPEGANKLEGGTRV